MRDNKLWKIFSTYIRLRDSDENGFCRCITCGRVAFYKKMDCGHGLGRQHLGIKYNEKNNHAQCGNCNLDGGRQDVYKEEVNKRYGENTWALLELAKKQVCRWTDFEIYALTTHYKQEVKRLMAEKGLQ